MPASRAWSSSRALSGAALVAERRVEVGRRQVEGVGAQAALVGVERHAAEPSRIADPQLGPVGEPQGEAVPPGIVATARVLEPVDGGGAVDEQAAGHAEAQAQSRPGTLAAVEVEHQQLAATACRRHRAAGDRRHHLLGRTALDEPRVRGADGDDRPADHGLGLAPVELDLQQLGHGGQRTAV